MGEDQDLRGDEEEETPEGQRFVREYLRLWEVMQGTTTNRVIAERLSALLGRRVREERVSQWRTGVHKPNAAVFLAMIEATEQSVDQVLFEGIVEQATRELRAERAERDATFVQLRDEIQALRRQLEEQADRWGMSIRGRGEVRLGPPAAETEPEPPDA